MVVRPAGRARRPRRPRGRRSTAGAAVALAGAAALLGSAGADAVAPCRPLDVPRDGEISFGLVSARLGGGAARARLAVDGRAVARARVRDGRARFRLGGAPRLLGVLVVRAGRSCAAAHRVWLLPRSGRAARRERGRDAGLARTLRRLGLSFGGWSAYWVHDLRTGRTAGWNSDAPFPAASLVKVGVLVAAVDRFGADPADRRIAKELRDLAVWSSNLASNRLTLRLGGGSERAGAAVVQRTLHRLGATSSTFTGSYRLGTAPIRPLGDAPRPPPLLTHRRTTARDMGRVLLELHAAALGNRLAARRAGLTRHEASVALGLLLSSESRGRNLGLFRPALGPAVAMAQKHGWTSSVRHSAAIVYGTRGPNILVLLTYHPRIQDRPATLLGLRLVRAARLADSP